MATERGGAEQPLIYARYKENISHWFKEMTEYGMIQEQQDILLEVF